MLRQSLDAHKQDRKTTIKQFNMNNLPKPTTKQWIKALIAIALITLDVLGLIDTKSINTTKNNTNTELETQAQASNKKDDTTRSEGTERRSPEDDKTRAKRSGTEGEGGIIKTSPPKKQQTTITNNKIQTTWDY